MSPDVPKDDDWVFPEWRLDLLPPPTADQIDIFLAEFRIPDAILERARRFEEQRDEEENERNQSQMRSAPENQEEPVIQNVNDEQQPQPADSPPQDIDEDELPPMLLEHLVSEPQTGQDTSEDGRQSNGQV